MLVPVKWLKDYTNVNADINEFTDKMIMSGSNLETVEKLPEEMKGILVGRVDPDIIILSVNSFISALTFV